MVRFDLTGHLHSDGAVGEAVTPETRNADSNKSPRLDIVVISPVEEANNFEFLREWKTFETHPETGVTRTTHWKNVTNLDDRRLLLQDTFVSFMLPKTGSDESKLL